VAAQFSHFVGTEHIVHEFDGRRLADWFPAAVWITEGRCHPSHMHFLDGMLTGDLPTLPQFHGLGGDAIAGGGFDDARELDDGALERACKRKILDLQHWWPGSVESVWDAEFVRMFDDVPEAVWRYFVDLGPWPDNQSAYLWFRHTFRLAGMLIPGLGSQVLPWAPLLAPYLDPTFFRIASSIRTEDMAGRVGQIRWSLCAYPEVTKLPRVKDGALVPVLDPGLYEPRMRRLLWRRKARYLIARATQGRVNFGEPEGFPNYNRWYRMWPRVRAFVNDTLLSRTSLDRGLWREEGLRSLLRDLRVGHNVWNGVSTVLQLELFLEQVLDGRVPAAASSNSLDLIGKTDVDKRSSE
jgi:hypothetical protein